MSGLQDFASTCQAIQFPCDRYHIGPVEVVNIDDVGTNLLRVCSLSTDVDVYKLFQQRIDLLSQLFRVIGGENRFYLTHSAIWRCEGPVEAMDLVHRAVSQLLVLILVHCGVVRCVGV